MRRITFASPGSSRRRHRFGLRLAAVVSGVLTLGFLTPLPAHAAPGELVARDGAAYEYNDAVVRVVLVRRVNHPVSVGYRTVSRTAVDGVDYVGKTGRVFFPAGSKVRKVRITLIDDNVDEPNEVFRLRLFDARRAVILDPVARVTIVDDDVAQAISVRDASAQEGSALGFTVSLSQVAQQTVTFRYATSTGTAGAGDFTATSGTASIPAGAYQTTITVPTVEDTLYEAAETMRLTLSDVSGAAAGDLDATGTILNDDTAPQLRINDVSVSEGNSTAMTVSLDRASGAATQVAWHTTDGTAKYNVDYVRDSGTLTIPAGATSGTITVRTYEDTTVDFGEVFYVDLSSPVGATIADGRGVVTILDDDGPALTVSDATALEDAKTITFTVRLSYDPVHTVSFTWSTFNGSATAPADYTAVAPKTETITSGTTKTLTVTLNDDAIDEPDETFGVLISNVVGATLADDTAVGRILDEDAVLSISPTALTVKNGAKATLTVSLPRASTEAITVKWATHDGTAKGAPAPGDDYVSASGTLSFAAGETTRLIEVQTVDDDDTSAETFTVKLSDATNATIGVDTAIVTIAP